MALKKTSIFFVFITIVIIIHLTSESYQKELIEKYKTSVYETNQESTLDKFNNIYFKYYYDSIEKTNKLVKTLNIKHKILNPQSRFEYFTSDGTVIKLYDKNAKEVFSNGIDDYSVKKTTKQNYIEYFIKNPQFSTDLLQSERGLYISNLVPIYDGELIGVFEINIQLDQVVKELNDSNLKLIILLNENGSKDIDLNLSHSRMFLNKRYIVNKNSDKYYSKILEQSDILKDDRLNKFIDKKGGVIIVKQPLSNNIADAYIIKSIDDISFEDDFLIFIFNSLTILIISFITLVFYIYTKSSQNKDLIYENQKLVEDNKDLKTISSELDFNEKKLSNLFNLQPNIMFISNGFSIVQVNRRFMGFFRRYKTFENFKSEHNCISELFEKTELAHYITSGLIDEKDWLEYILENPKKLYKTIMSVDDEQHHFLIKVNEMNYVQKFKERYIVVAFVDITQDLNNKVVEKELSCEINSDFDISFIIENSITLVLNEYTNIVPTKQSIFKATLDDEINLNCISMNLQLLTKNKKLNWKIILPITSLSYIYNLSSSKYDGRIAVDLNDDLKDMSIELVDNIGLNLVKSINNSDNRNLDDFRYSIDKTIDTYKGTIEHVYKFEMFIDNKEVDIFIQFDNDSLFYVRQIQMLGAFFD